MNTSEGVKSEIYPLIWIDDVGALLDWAIAAFDMRGSWRASSEEGQIEHGELNWGRDLPARARGWCEHYSGT
jgi:hypothetical protein